ncbi:hypothetical protein CPB86DRAFT_724359 [Serendipita vermifera]|nr:hypothetical protein CPB86DRAFT_724359 [Serendipita vermifera]
MPISFVGKVTKAGFMNKTVTVSVDRMIRHDKTHKLLKRTTKYLTHDPNNVLRTEDIVRIRSCPRKSLKKHFEFDVVLKRGWEGQEFDRKYPKKAAPVLVNERELVTLKEQVEAYELEKKAALEQKASEGVVTSSQNPDLSGATMGSQKPQEVTAS